VLAEKSSFERRREAIEDEERVVEDGEDEESSLNGEEEVADGLKERYRVEVQAEEVEEEGLGA
jgi:hypothetical protein